MKLNHSALPCFYPHPRVKQSRDASGASNSEIQDRQGRQAACLGCPQTPGVSCLSSAPLIDTTQPLAVGADCDMTNQSTLVVTAQATLQEP